MTTTHTSKVIAHTEKVVGVVYWVPIPFWKNVAIQIKILHWKWD